MGECIKKSIKYGVQFSGSRKIGRCNETHQQCHCSKLLKKFKHSHTFSLNQDIFNSSQLHFSAVCVHRQAGHKKEDIFNSSQLHFSAVCVHRQAGHKKGNTYRGLLRIEHSMFYVILYKVYSYQIG